MSPTQIPQRDPSPWESFLLYVGMKLWRYQLRLHLYWTRAWVLTAFWTMLGRGTR